MTRSTGSAYAGWEPRTCCVCGRKITHQTGGCFRYNHGRPYTTCTRRECIRGAPR